MANHNWDYLYELGFAEDYLVRQEASGWSNEILDLLTDPDFSKNYKSNAGQMLNYFTYEEVFHFMMTYPSSFMMSPSTFEERLLQIVVKLGNQWCCKIRDQFWKDTDECILRAIGYLRDSDWEEELSELR